MSQSITGIWLLIIYCPTTITSSYTRQRHRLISLLEHIPALNLIIQWLLPKLLFFAKTEIVKLILFSLLLLLFLLNRLFLALLIWRRLNGLDHVHVFEIVVVFGVGWVASLWQVFVWLQAHGAVAWFYVVALADFAKWPQPHQTFCFSLPLFMSILPHNFPWILTPRLLLFLRRERQGIIRRLSMPIIILKRIPNTIITINIIDGAITLRWERLRFD